MPEPSIGSPCCCDWACTCLAHVLYMYSCREDVIQCKPMRRHVPEDCLSGYTCTSAAPPSNLESKTM